MPVHPTRFATLVAIALLSGVRTSGAQVRMETAQPAGASFVQAAAGVAITNWVTWAYNWYVQRWPWAKVGTESWGQNLRHGFVWDDDCFLDNQLAHPYHGSFYHSSARASGYGFWGSFPFVAAGSAGWELFGENIRASLNDLVNTTLGGMAIGEVTYRLSRLVGSDRDVSRNSFSRELAAFALSPMGRTQSLLSNRAERQPDSAPLPQESTVLAMGRRSGEAFLELAVNYGNVFDPGNVQPYDAFEFRLQISPGASGIFQRVGISGLLARQSLARSARNQVIFGVFQHYDYEDLTHLKFSGHSVSAALLYQHRIDARSQVRLGAHAEGLALGGISTDRGHFWRRDYDLGPGAGARIGASFARDGLEWLRLDGRLLWLHSIHGSGANHLATFVRLGAAVPVIGPVGLGGDLSMTTRHSRYPDFPPVNQRVRHLRAYLTWIPD
jgi:Domain of unknown function (DUF3943)